MKKIETAFARQVIRLRWLVIPLSLVCVFIAASGGRFLHFTSDYRVYFGKDNPQLQAFEAMEKSYTKNDNVLIVLTPADGNVFTGKTLALVEEVTKRAWQIPYSIRVDSLSNFQYTEAEGDDLIVRDLVSGAENYTAAELSQVREIVMKEPLLAKRLVSMKGHVTAVNVTIQLPRKTQAVEVPEVIRYSRQIADGIRANHPDVQVHLTGVSFMNNAFSEAAQLDISTLLPISFGVMILCLALLLKGLSGTVTTLMVIVLSIMTAMGLGGFLGIPLTPSSAPAPIIILTVAIANSVHILVTFYNELRRGIGKREAIHESLRINLQPVFLTSITTAIGFLTMNFSDVPPFIHLGNLVAMGVLASFILAVTLLPALMAVLPVRPGKGDEGRLDFMTRLGDFVVVYRNRLLWGVSLMVIVLVAFIPRNEFNDIFVHYFDHRIKFRTDTDYVTDNLTGLYNINYSLSNQRSGGVSDPEFLRNVENYAIWLRSQPEVIHVASITDIFKRLNKNMHGDDERWYRLPEERELAAQYLLLYEMSLPYGLDLNNQINIDKSATRMTVTLKTLSTNQILAFEERAAQWLTGNAPAIVQMDAASPNLMFSHIAQRNIVSMLTGTTVALVLISALLVIALRSVKIGLISMVPNLIPAAMGFGLWGMLVGEVGLALSVVASMTLGIVVDDTVHFLSKYIRARREQGLSSEDAVRYAFSNVGRALLFTSVILVAGFLVLSTSAFHMNSGMGMLSAIVITMALLADFFLLPALLIKLEERKDEKRMPGDPTVHPVT